MRGTYCLIMNLEEHARVIVGSLGEKEFPSGIYIYVGSALSGLESRVSRHRSVKKKRRWHIDYLLDNAEVLSVIAIPTSRRSTECEVMQTLATCEGASFPVDGFGSSDCRCRSHLVCFGESDPEWVAEMVSMRLAMLKGVYQRTSGQ